ncbi:hypothetical protein NEFER03_1255 [Nematocida sp. LUAm3]|nr:hypothetical protein NEFER03_1255 [Nematocida sp. LUAm3]KAI5174123.1 hypothetical protein NEFER02_0590 [Nematocida sp. LUAm2]KAI5177134.1 hypothetical protein NEFER01_0409 [Nematocida sp. LUAm1]
MENPSPIRIISQNSTPIPYTFIAKQDLNLLETQIITYSQERHTGESMCIFYKPHKDDLIALFCFMLWNVLLYILICLLVSVCLIGMVIFNESTESTLIDVSNMVFYSKIYALAVFFLSNPFIQSYIVIIQDITYETIAIFISINASIYISLILMYRAITNTFMRILLSRLNRAFKSPARFIDLICIWIFIVIPMAALYRIITGVWNEEYIKKEDVKSRNTKTIMLYIIWVVFLVITASSLASIVCIWAQYKSILRNQCVIQHLIQSPHSILSSIPQKIIRVFCIKE